MIQYNSLNLPTVIAFTDGSTTKYTYDASGRKLRTEHKVMTTAAFHPEIDDAGDAGIAPDPAPDAPAAEVGEGEVDEEWPQMPSFEELEQLLGEELAEEEGMEAGEEPTLPAMEPTEPTQPTVPSIINDPSAYQPYELTVIDYCGNFIYENGKLSRILFDGGFITFPDTTVNEVTIANIHKPQYHFYFTDHLGNIRVVTDAQGNVEQVNNYYPYGGLMASSSSIATPSSSYPANQPYRYNGKELDRKNNLDWMDYGARHFAGHGQWTSPDPLAEKYYDWSPYVYCVGNPMRYIDPNGMDWYETSSGNIMWKASVKSQSDLSDDEKYIGERYQGLIIKKYEETSENRGDVRGKGLEIIVGFDYGNNKTEGNWIQNIQIVFFNEDGSQDIKIAQYVDESDSNKPFYFSPDELECQRNYMGEKWIFEDSPAGNVKTNKQWDAELSFIEKNNQGYVLLNTIRYGYTIFNEQIKLKEIQYITNPSTFQKNIINNLNK